MPSSRSPMRWRFFAAGATAVLAAVGAGGLIDRSLVLAEAAPQLRFAASAAAMLVLLVVPLMVSLERWVIRPLQALDDLHDPKRPVDRSALRTAALPKEMAEVIGHHTQLLSALKDTNARLQDEVDRRTRALEVIIASADALSRTRPGVHPADALLPELATLTEGSAAVLVGRKAGQWVASVVPPAPIDPDARDMLEQRLQKALGRQASVRIEWMRPLDEDGEPVSHLRVLVREPLGPDPATPAALVLLSVRPGGIAPAAEDLHRVLSTIGTWVVRTHPELLPG